MPVNRTCGARTRTPHRFTLAHARRIRHGGPVTQAPDPTESIREAPWKVGIRAARANFLPGLVIQCAMVALLVAYHRHPPTTELLNRLAELRQSTGYAYSVVSAMIAGALIPEILRVAFFQKGRLERRNFDNLLFTLPFWGIMAVSVDLFYQLQARIFGTDPDFITVASKVLLDQLGYTALFATPVTCILYDWRQRGYRMQTLTLLFTRGYYRNVVFPVLITNWAVWVPLITVIYCLPLTLQVPLFGLALSLWVLLYTWISETRNPAT